MLPNTVDTLYILSAGHSGSTLLNLVLGSHSHAVAVSELTRLPANIAHNETCTCGRAIRECVYWRDVAVRLQSKLGFDMISDPRRLELGFIGAPRGSYRGSLPYRLSWRIRRSAAYLSQLTGVSLPAFMRQRFDVGIANRLAVYDAVREASGAKVVVDASKGYLPGVAVYQAQPARTRLLLLTRDGRAVFYSNLRRGFRQSYSMSVWRNFYRNGLPVIRRRVDPNHILHVRYEDLATNPETEVRRICEFANLGYEKSMLDPGAKQQHITSGNDMRLRLNTRIQFDAKWRSELLDSDRAYFERHAGSLNRRLGYE